MREDEINYTINLLGFDTKELRKYNLIINEELLDIVYGVDDIPAIDEKKLGYNIDEIPSEPEIEESARLIKYNDLYLVAVIPSLIDDCEGVAAYSSRIFDNYDDAHKYFDSLKYMYPCFSEYCKNMEQELPDIVFRIREHHRMYTTYDIYVSGNLVAEFWRLPSAEELREIADEYYAWEKDLEEKGLTGMKIYKMPRAWNDNQRYYAFAFHYEGKWYKHKVHIPSKLQARARKTTDLFSLERFVKENVSSNQKGESDKRI